MNIDFGKIIGKENFKMDNNIPISYIVRKGFTVGSSIFWGQIKSIGIKKRGKRPQISRTAKLIQKNNIVLGNNVRIGEEVEIDALSENGITLGNNVKIGNKSSVFCTGSLEKIGKGLKIGSNSFFSESTFFGAAGGIDIGENVISGQNVRFHSENHLFDDLNKLIKEQGTSSEGIIIGNDCWIGSGAVFLDGSQIDDGCVVAANAVVSGVFPKNSVIGGVPAKLIRKRGNL